MAQESLLNTTERTNCSPFRYHQFGNSLVENRKDLHNEPMANSRKKRGFTLVELLVAIAIIGALIAISIPAVQFAREAARRTHCQNNLRQVGLALNNYDSARNKFPPGQMWSGSRKHLDTIDYAWSAAILPYLEEGSTYAAIDFDKSYLEPVNRQAVGTIVDTYLCPSTAITEEHRVGKQIYGIGDRVALGAIDYLGISGPHRKAKNPQTQLKYGPQAGVLIGTKWLVNGDKLREPPAVTTASIIDGLSKTICVSECAGRGLEKDGDPNGAWVSGKNVTHVDRGVNDASPSKSWNSERIFSQHSGGAFGLYCEGRVSFLDEATDPIIIRALCSRNGSDIVDAR